MLTLKRFPVLFQHDNQDCGPTCLEMILRYYGKTHTRQHVCELCQQDRQGASLAAIARAAERLGFRTLAVKVSFDELKDKALLPCIAFWPQGHFVVVYKVTNDNVFIADPSIGAVKYSRQEFETCWLTDSAERNWGVLLLLEPTSRLDVNTSATSYGTVDCDLWKPLWRDSRRQIFPVVLALLVSLFIQLVIPFLSSGLVDLGITKHNLNIIYVFLAAELVLTLSRISVELFQRWILTYIGVRTDIRLVAQFLMKLTRLPLSFFERKMTGDLLQRIGDLKTIQQFLTNSLWQVLLSATSLAIFATVLAMFSPALLLIFAVGSIAYLVYTALFIKRQRILSYKNFRLSARKQGLTIEFLSGMQEIKLNNAEEHRRWQWEAAEHAIARNQVKSSLLSQFQVAGGMAISEIKNLVITLLVARSVVSGEMSLGTMVAVQYVLGQLNWPLSQMTILMAQSHEAVLSYRRAKEIHGLPEETTATAVASPDECADIVFSNVEFGYGGTTNNKLFRNLNLRIPYGKTTAIVGRSGSGKTTLLKLLLKFYPVDSGELTIGSVNIDDISDRLWRQACGIVMQDGYIFSDSILNNIAVAEDTIDMDRVAEVVHLAEIGTFIESLPLSYQTRIGKDGIGISRGQAQRILMARALYKDPSYVFFDEATSALDAETESLIVNKLHNVLKGKTVVVIAHRMSTIKHADQIVLLDQGEVIEMGTHQQLVASQGSYFDLVRNQLDLAG